MDATDAQAAGGREFFSIDGSEEELLAALNRGRLGQGLEPSSSALWRWRAAAPDGAIAGVHRTAGQITAAVVGVRHQVRLEGELVPWIEVVEVFNDFERGQGLARTRAYLELLEAFAREHGGQAPDAANVLYGIPTRRVHRIGLARLKHEILRSENLLSVRPSSVHWNESDVEVTEVERFTDEVEGPVQRFSETRPAILVRDAARLNWRYADHPERTYRLAEARRGGDLRGYVVLRTGEYGGRSGGLLVDWLVPPDEHDVAIEMLRWAAAATREQDRLIVNVPDMSPEFGAFQAVGFRAAGADDYLVFRGFQKPFIMSWLFMRWHYTLGDTERG